MAAACAVVAFASCEKDNGGENTDNGEGSGSDTEYAAPTITWEGHDDFTAELESEMDVKIQITAEAGIKSFIVGVDSDVLDPIISVVNSGSTDMDLINGPETLLAFLSSESIGLPTGENLTGQTNLTLDLSNLVPLIIDMGNQQGTLNPDSDHIFTLSLTDNADRPLSQKVTFHYTGTTSQEPITMTWEGNPNFDEVELTSDLTVKINIAAAAGISSFVVKVDSENETFMEIIKNITTHLLEPRMECLLVQIL